MEEIDIHQIDMKFFMSEKALAQLRKNCTEAKIKEKNIDIESTAQALAVFARAMHGTDFKDMEMAMSSAKSAAEKREGNEHPVCVMVSTVDSPFGKFQVAMLPLDRVTSLHAGDEAYQEVSDTFISLHMKHGSCAHCGTVGHGSSGLPKAVESLLNQIIGKTEEKKPEEKKKVEKKAEKKAEKKSEEPRNRINFFPGGSNN